VSELPAGLAPAADVVPRSSASTIVLRQGPDGREVLLGVRSRKSRFMPGQWVFPGGVLEPQDAGDFARCAARELAEETGLVVDAPTLIPAGERTTPAMFPVRFHTEFFVAQVPSGGEEPAPPTDEIERLVFVRPGAIVERWASGTCAIPPPVLSMLRALASEIDEPIETIVETLVAANAQEQRAPRIEFAPDIWMLPVRTMTMPPATTTNVWMPGGEKFVVIDPGSADPAEQARLLEVIGRRTALGHSVEAVLLTHEHQDHVAGVVELCAELGVPLRAHEKTMSLSRFDRIEHRERLADGDLLDLDGLTLRALHTPGHSPGHLAFEIVGRRTLIAGDLVSAISTILIEPRTGSMADYLASLERMRANGYRTLLPGHGPPIPARALENLIDHRRRRETAVLDQLSDERAELGSIARGAYRELPDLPQKLIELQTLSHLIDLERRGAVRRVSDERVWERI